MKILIDTNVWLDVALGREGFSEHSFTALCECIDSNDEAFIAATSLKDVFYIVSRIAGSNAAYRAVDQILEIANAATIDDAICRNALALERPDYEDGLIAASIQAESIDVVITRDKTAFHELGIPVCTPSDFISQRGYELIDLPSQST